MTSHELLTHHVTGATAGRLQQDALSLAYRAVPGPWASPGAQVGMGHPHVPGHGQHLGTRPLGTGKPPYALRGKAASLFTTVPAPLQRDDSQLPGCCVAPVTHAHPALQSTSWAILQAFGQQGGYLGSCLIGPFAQWDVFAQSPAVHDLQRGSKRALALPELQPVYKTVAEGCYLSLHTHYIQSC